MFVGQLNVTIHFIFLSVLQLMYCKCYKEIIQLHYFLFSMKNFYSILNFSAMIINTKLENVYAILELNKVAIMKYYTTKGLSNEI